MASSVEAAQILDTAGPKDDRASVFCLPPVAEQGAAMSYGTTAIASMEMSRPRGSLTIGDERAGGLVGKYSA